jgi:hypothetical protein
VQHEHGSGYLDIILLAELFEDPDVAMAVLLPSRQAATYLLTQPDVADRNDVCAL